MSEIADAIREGASGVVLTVLVAGLLIALPLWFRTWNKEQAHD